MQDIAGQWVTGSGDSVGSLKLRPSSAQQSRTTTCAVFGFSRLAGSSCRAGVVRFCAAFHVDVVATVDNIWTGIGEQQFLCVKRRANARCFLARCFCPMQPAVDIVLFRWLAIVRHAVRKDFCTDARLTWFPAWLSLCFWEKGAPEGKIKTRIAPSWLHLRTARLLERGAYCQPEPRMQRQNPIPEQQIAYVSDVVERGIRCRPGLHFRRLDHGLGELHVLPEPVKVASQCIPFASLPHGLFSSLPYRLPGIELVTIISPAYHSLRHFSSCVYCAASRSREDLKVRRSSIMPELTGATSVRCWLARQTRICNNKTMR